MADQAVPGAGHGSDLAPRSEGEQRDFCAVAIDRACRAELVIGAIQHDLEICGTIIRLMFAGAALATQLLPALRHLLVEEAGTPDVIFHVWDTESTGIEMAPPPCQPTCFTYRGEIWTFLSKRVRSAYHFSDHSLSLLDLDRREGVFWLQQSASLPYWTIASPLRTLLHWWMEERGGQLLHAAAIGTEDGGLLLTGMGGVGKSTTALTCLAEGMSYVGDDYVLVTLDPEPVVHSLYATAKVNVEAIDRFRQFGPRLLASPAGVPQKAVMFLDGSPALTRRLPLRAIATPSFAAGAETSFAATSADMLCTAASFSTLCQLPHAGRRTIDFVDRLVAELPRRELRLGSDIDAVPRAIRRFLEAPIEPDSTAPTAAEWPKLSVVIPVHNGSPFLADAVASILAQECGSPEIIVVDDGSVDAIEEAVADLPVAVRLLRQANAGPAAARNRGIRDASGEVIGFLDVDDLWPRGKLRAALAAFAADPTLDVVTGPAQLVSAEGDYVDSAEGSFPHYIGAALFRRSTFARIGAFDERLRFAEDTDWFARAGDDAVNIARLNRIMLLVRRHRSNMTRGLAGGDVLPMRLLKNVLDRKRLRAAAGRAR